MIGLPLLEIPGRTSSQLEELLDEVDDDEQDEKDPGRYCQVQCRYFTRTHITSYLKENKFKFCILNSQGQVTQQLEQIISSGIGQTGHRTNLKQRAKDVKEQMALEQIAVEQFAKEQMRANFVKIIAGQAVHI